jgi:molybdopterin converting factor subunit 1
MEIQLLFFGITEDIIGQKSMHLELKENATVAAVKSILSADFPRLNQYNSFSVAVNMEYAEDSTLLNSGDTLALIPPVSGG